METEKGIPILETVKFDGEKLANKIVMNAFKTMTESLVKMEKDGVAPGIMMEKCVWPILHETAKRFDTISKGDVDIPEGGFESVVG